MSQDDEQRITATLIRGPLNDFASARTARARELSTQGDRELAGRIAALRKPSLALWTLNQAGAVAAAELDEVRSAGEALRSAQERVLQGERAAAAELQRATQAQHRAIDVLSRRLGMVLTAAGHAASEQTLRRVSDALRTASIADSQTWEELREGRLLAGPVASSLPEMDVAGMRRITDERAVLEAETQRNRVADAEAEVQRAEQVARAAREQEQAAAQRREQAEQAVEAARSALTKLLRGG